MPVFVVVENWTLEDFFSLVTFSELLNLTVICEVWDVGADAGGPELVTVAGGFGSSSTFDIDIEVWFQRADSCSLGAPGPTVAI